jgi:nickel-dependent lactate racemase
MVNLLGNLPAIEKNPVNLEMLEAAEKAGVDFILNVVTNSKKDIVEVVAGDCKDAWYAGVKTSAEMYHVPIEEKADVAIVSAGGYPKDINIYQAQKGLDNADYGTKDGGTIILIAECRAGLGEETFEDWVSNSKKPKDNLDRIKEKFVLGGHKAFAISKVVMDKEFILISDLNEEISNSLFAKKIDSIEDALSYVDEKYNGNYTSIVMPQGGLTLPSIN